MLWFYSQPFGGSHRLPDAALSPIIQEFWTEPAAQLAKLAYADSNQALEKLG